MSMNVVACHDVKTLSSVSCTPLSEVSRNEIGNTIGEVAGNVQYIRLRQNKQLNEHTDGRTYKQTYEHTNEQTTERTNKRTTEQPNEHTNEKDTPTM